MQEQIKLGRTIEQCKEDCNIAKEENKDFNRGRCRQNCANMNPNDRSGSCRDCYTNYGEGNRRARCLESCDAGNERRCEEASTCEECRSYCRSGERSSCFRDVDPRGRCDRRPGQRCGGQRKPKCGGSKREAVCCPNDPRDGRGFSYQCLRRGRQCPRYALEGAEQLDFLMDHS